MECSAWFDERGALRVYEAFGVRYCWRLDRIHRPLHFQAQNWKLSFQGLVAGEANDRRSTKCNEQREMSKILWFIISQPVGFYLIVQQDTAVKRSRFRRPYPFSTLSNALLLSLSKTVNNRG